MVSGEQSGVVDTTGRGRASGSVVRGCQSLIEQLIHNTNSLCSVSLIRDW